MPNTAPPTGCTSTLLKFQIGPVQDFIAQARSTRDLWSGSYLLSWLVAAGIRKLRADGGALIFPNDAKKCQPLLELPDSARVHDHTNLLTPNLPNIFIANVSAENPGAVAKAVNEAIKDEWKKIATAVWDQRQRIGLPDSTKTRYDAQVDRHLSISWMITSLTDDSPAGYLHAYQHNGWHLDGVRQSRHFQAWASCSGGTEKDSLSGKEEALVGGRDYQKARAREGGDYAKLFKHADYLGAVAIIKRVWHLAYLRDTQKLKTGPGQHFIRSIPAIAARTNTEDDDELAQEKTSGEKYIAAIAFDGDSIGRWVNGDFLPDQTSLKQHHLNFSQALSKFALGEVRKIVEGTREAQANGIWKGQLIYAGGDDVVALVPADIALEVAQALRNAFRENTNYTPTEAGAVQPDASAGIAIAHIHAPLQDLIRKAQKAEKRAKNTVGRPAFSITLMKRSGEISHWGSKWSSNGLELYLAIAQRVKPDALSAKFPHRVSQLLTPYLTQTTGLSKQQDAITDIAVAKDLITREFAYAAEQQGSEELARQLDGPLRKYLEGILNARSEREGATGKSPSQTASQELLTSIIDLCTTVAFAQRNETDSTSAEKLSTPAV